MYSAAGDATSTPPWPAHGDGLETLGAEHGARATSAGGVLQVEEVGVEHLVLAGLPDGSGAEVGAQLAPQDGLRLLGVLAPEVSRVAQLDLGPVDDQVHRLGGDPGDDDPVPAGVLELRTEVTAHVARRDGAR